MKNILIVYWSGTGNTEQMAAAIAEGAKNENVEVELLPVSQATLDKVKNANALALGCPSMGSEVLEEYEMEPFVESISNDVSGKPLALFGSYDWGDGQWMREWVERMEDCGANLIHEGLIIHLTPEDDGLEECKELGKKLAEA
ncbi:MAG: flavodoxin [Clostridiaceae bacterium]